MELYDYYITCTTAIKIIGIMEPDIIVKPDNSFISPCGKFAILYPYNNKSHNARLLTMENKKIILAICTEISEFNKNEILRIASLQKNFKLIINNANQIVGCEYPIS